MYTRTVAEITRNDTSVHSLGQRNRLIKLLNISAPFQQKFLANHNIRFLCRCSLDKQTQCCTLSPVFSKLAGIVALLQCKIITLNYTDALIFFPFLNTLGCCHVIQVSMLTNKAVDLPLKTYEQL